MFKYYNDAANNCTWGVGSLAHHGPCTAEELRRPVSVAEVNQQLAVRVRGAESLVRKKVSNYRLSQSQFDALVSFAFNTGAAGARAALSAANRGSLIDVATLMGRSVYIHPRDAEGKKLPPICLQGLVARRQDEAAPFLSQQGTR